MKSIVNNKPTNAKLFPKLIILQSTKTIILAESIVGGRPHGSVISCPSKAFSIGDIDDFTSDFVDFEGSVTLSND